MVDWFSFRILLNQNSKIEATKVGTFDDFFPPEDTLLKCINDPK